MPKIDRSVVVKNRAEFLSALRKTPSSPPIDHLRVGDKRSALGVATEVLTNYPWVLHPQFENIDPEKPVEPFYTAKGLYNIAPEEVHEALGTSFRFELSVWANERSGFTHGQIADLCEAQPGWSEGSLIGYLINPQVGVSPALADEIFDAA